MERTPAPLRLRPSRLQSHVSPTALLIVLIGGCEVQRPAEERTAGAADTHTGFALEEATIDQLQEAMRTGRYTARALTEAYLARIDTFDRRGPMLASMLDLNPDALAIADSLDAERRSGTVRGPLHGIPI